LHCGRTDGCPPRTHSLVMTHALWKLPTNGCWERWTSRMLNDPILNSSPLMQAVSEPGTHSRVVDGTGLAPEPLWVTPLRKTVRKRNKAHLSFVAAQPCLVCRRSPCDAHHLRFAQPRALGRKVSDEFTVPMCRDHHQDLHRHGNELGWWANLQIAPIEVARDLWQETHRDPDMSIVRKASTGDAGIREAD